MLRSRFDKSGVQNPRKYTSPLGLGMSPAHRGSRLISHLFHTVAYLGPADIYSKPLLTPLIGVDQPVIRTRNRFSTLQPTQLTSI